MPLPEKSNHIKQVSAKFVHDIRTPLLTIKKGAADFKEILPYLLQAYQNAVAEGLIAPLKVGAYNGPLEVCASIEQQADDINYLVDEFWAQLLSLLEENKSPAVNS